MILLSANLVFEAQDLPAPSKSKFSLFLLILVVIFVVASLSKLAYKASKSYRNPKRQISAKVAASTGVAEIVMVPHLTAAETTAASVETETKTEVHQQ